MGIALMSSLKLPRKLLGELKAPKMIKERLNLRFVFQIVDASVARPPPGSVLLSPVILTMPAAAIQLAVQLAGLTLSALQQKMISAYPN